MHDDIAVTVLFVSIAVEQDEFIDWIDDWFRQMEQYDLSEERMKLFRKVMAMMSSSARKTLRNSTVVLLQDSVS